MQHLRRWLMQTMIHASKQEAQFMKTSILLLHANVRPCMVAQILLVEIGPLIMGASCLFFVVDLPRCIVALPWIAAVSWRASLKLALFMRRAAVGLHVAPLACINTNITSCSGHLLSVTMTSSKGFAGVSAAFVVCFAGNCWAEHKQISKVCLCMVHCKSQQCCPWKGRSFGVLSWCKGIGPVPQTHICEHLTKGAYQQVHLLSLSEDSPKRMPDWVGLHLSDQASPDSPAAAADEVSHCDLLLLRSWWAGSCYLAGGWCQVASS